jgi:hypothetical protein
VAWSIPQSERVIVNQNNPVKTMEITGLKGMFFWERLLMGRGVQNILILVQR